MGEYHIGCGAFAIYAGKNILAYAIQRFIANGLTKCIMITL